MDNLDSRSEASSDSQYDLKSEEDQTIVQDLQLPENGAPELLEVDLQMSQIQEGLTEKVHKQLQLIYFAKYSPDYRQRLEQIAFNYGCDLSFGKNSFTVSCKDKSNHQKWTICKQEINQEFNKIIYTIVEDKEKRFKLYNSHQVNRFANQKGIFFCQFNSEVYMHTNIYSSKQLEEKKIQICKYCNIFAICFLKRKVLQAIDLEIAKFYRTVFEDHYKQRFQKNNIVVEINKINRSFYILGKPGTPQYLMMESKKTIKNMIEGVTVVAFKNFSLNSKQQVNLNDYLKKISKFPIKIGKLAENVVVLISKDNIFKELLKKTDKIIEKVGITNNTSMGIYMPLCYSRDQKREQIFKICKEMGYDFWSTWGIRYFRPMIACEDETKDPRQIIELIIRIMSGFGDVKDKYEIMKEKQKPQNKIDAKKKKQLEEQDKYAYIVKNSPKDSTQLTKVLRRDVMEDQVLMKKRYNVIYNLLEGKQIGPFYIDQIQYDRGAGKGDIKLIEQKGLKKGQYFETYLKLVDYSVDSKSIEEIQTLLIDELRMLKRAAKQGNEEGKGFDNERKIAHMIKKILNIF